MASQSSKNTTEAETTDFGDALKQQIDILKSDIAQLSADLVTASEVSSEAAVNAARDAGRKAINDAGDRMSHAGAQVENALSEVEDFARRHPGMALGMAAGAGFLLALSMSRR